ncbi:hypothetical protein [Sneathiella aquimaris]|uniref:hypothetical protein n=1 Tax=Sneathiella aquimaris TaxID=2599305 RepID=UPI00146D10B4|nr:hypothetical protein [Sneathiella aquimaris]
MKAGRLNTLLVKTFLLSSMILMPFTQATADSDASFQFYAISDFPYSADQEILLTEEITPAIRRARSPFVVHMGDLKSGGASCNTELLQKRAAQIHKLHDTAVFYTPGDNEWTDCDRDKLTNPASELEKLEEIRTLFFHNRPPFPNHLSVMQQPLYPENKIWHYNRTMFATLHMVGTNNGRAQILLDNVNFALSQVKARDVANRFWLETVFTQANSQNADAIVIAFQADISKARHSGKCTDEEPIACDGHAGFKEQVRSLAADYAKPVLLLHGDTSDYCMDKEFGGNRAPKLWRFNSAGDFKILDGVKITVQPDNPAEPFTMSTILGDLRPDDGC